MNGSRIIQKVQRRLALHMEVARIRLSAGYDRIASPELDPDFRDALLGPDGALDTLLAGVDPNTVARLLDGEMRVFGTRVRLSDPGFSWHRDFGSAHEYPRVPYPRIQIVPDRGTDIVVPWALSRLQHVPALVAAHRRTGDERLRTCFRNTVDSWRDANPYLIGVNWFSELEIAVRGLNLAVGLLWFGASPDDERLLWAHAETILARDFSPPKRDGNSHILGSAVGLLCMALCFRGERAKELTTRSCELLEAEILRQFLSDGGGFEASAHYHEFSLEASLVAAVFLRASGRRLSDPVRQRLGKAVGLVSNYVAAFGGSPQFGDSGDSRILVFDHYFDADPLDPRFLVPLARAALGDAALDSSENRGCAVFPESGYATHREQSYGVCLIASPVGTPGHSGHHHLDKTSFVMSVGEQPVFVDSGTACYTEDIQRRFEQRSTRAHNVIMLDGLEQGEITPEAVFGRPESVHAWLRSSEAGHFELGHDGYRRFLRLGDVERHVVCERDEVLIEERLAGSGLHHVELLFHLHPRVQVETRADDFEIKSAGRVLCRLQRAEGFVPTFETAAYSAAYREQEPHHVLVLTRKLELPAVVRYAIRVPAS